MVCKGILKGFTKRGFSCVLGGQRVKATGLGVEGVGFRFGIRTRR